MGDADNWLGEVFKSDLKETSRSFYRAQVSHHLELHSSVFDKAHVMHQEVSNLIRNLSLNVKAHSYCSYLHLHLASAFKPGGQSPMADLEHKIGQNDRTVHSGRIH